MTKSSDMVIVIVPDLRLKEPLQGSGLRADVKFDKRRRREKRSIEDNVIYLD